MLVSSSCTSEHDASLVSLVYNNSAARTMVVSRQALRCREEAESGRELREALQGVSINTAQPALTTVIHRTQQRWARAGCSTRRFPASELLEVLVLWRASSHRLKLLVHRPVLHEPPSAIPRRASPQRVLRCSLLHDSSSGGASGQLAAGVALRAHLLGSARTRRCLAIASRAPRHVLIGRSTGGVGLTAELATRDFLDVTIFVEPSLCISAAIQ